VLTPFWKQIIEMSKSSSFLPRWIRYPNLSSSFPASRRSSDDNFVTGDARDNCSISYHRVIRTRGMTRRCTPFDIMYFVLEHWLFKHYVCIEDSYYRDKFLYYKVRGEGAYIRGE